MDQDTAFKRYRATKMQRGSCYVIDNVTGSAMFCPTEEQAQHRARVLNDTGARSLFDDVGGLENPGTIAGPPVG